MAQQGFEQWYKEIPPVTRFVSTVALAASLSVFVDFFNPFGFYLNWNLIFGKLELWRLVTNFFFFDYIGLGFFFHLYFLSQLEEEFAGRTGDYVFLWLFGGSLLLLISFVFYVLQGYGWPVPKLMFMGPSLTFMMVYIWSRRNPDLRMSFLGLFDFDAPFLAWVILGFGWMLGQDPVPDLLGIAVGHVYYFLDSVLPANNGPRLLATPAFFQRIFAEAPRPQDFGGNGQRLH